MMMKSILTSMFLILYLLNYSQDSLCKIEKFQKKYFIQNCDGIDKKRISEPKFFELSMRIATKKKYSDLLLLTRKAKKNTHRMVGFSVMGGIITVIGGAYFIGTLMEYPNAYKTEKNVKDHQNIGITVALSALTVGITFETLSVFNNRKKNKRVYEMINLYNEYIK